MLHNKLLRTDELAAGVAQQLVAHLGHYTLVRIALDWTVEGDKHLLVASAVLGRRALPLYWRAYAAGTFKRHRSQLERAFVTRLCKFILRDVPRHKLLLTADRGVADVQLFDLLDDLQVAFVIRTKENVKVFCNGQWRKLKTLRLRGNTRRRSLGRLRYGERAPRRLYPTQSRARTRQGSWGLWYLVSNRNFSAVQAKQEYAWRWGCECGFRDAKHLLGLKDADIRDPQAYARMFTLVASALLLLAIIGCAFVTAAPATAQQRLRRVCADRSTHCELSLFGAVRWSCFRGHQILLALAPFLVKVQFRLRSLKISPCEFVRTQITQRRVAAEGVVVTISASCLKDKVHLTHQLRNW